MKVLALIRPAAGAARGEISANAEEELRALWGLYRDGSVREMYSPGGLGAVLILEGDAIESVAAALRRPLLENGIMRLELIELQPFRAFEMLFA